MFRTCVSLLPAATQMILDMGLADSLRGVTHFCPLQAQKRCPVLLRIQDGQAHLQVSTIQELQPDVIFTQSTCQACLMDEEELKNQLVVWQSPSERFRWILSGWKRSLVQLLQIADALGFPEQGKAYVEALRGGWIKFLHVFRKRRFQGAEWVFWNGWILFFTRVIGFQIRFAWQEVWTPC